MGLREMAGEVYVADGAGRAGGIKWKPPTQRFDLKQLNDMWGAPYPGKGR